MSTKIFAQLLGNRKSTPKIPQTCRSTRKKNPPAHKISMVMMQKWQLQKSGGLQRGQPRGQLTQFGSPCFYKAREETRLRQGRHNTQLPSQLMTRMEMRWVGRAKHMKEFPVPVAHSALIMHPIIWNGWNGGWLLPLSVSCTTPALFFCGLGMLLPLSALLIPWLKLISVVIKLFHS